MYGKFKHRLGGTACDESFGRESFDLESFNPELATKRLRIERLRVDWLPSASSGLEPVEGSRVGFKVPG